MSRFKGFGTLFGIELKLNVRDMNMVVFAIAMPLVVLAVLGGLSSWRIPFPRRWC